MSETPPGIPKFQRDQISTLAQEFIGKSTDELVADVEAHVALAVAAKADNPMVNVKLATLIGDRLKSALSHWGELGETQQFWLLGAVAYFAASDDEEDDFRSPIGFEDDAEIFNACVRFAGHASLVINQEDF